MYNVALCYATTRREKGKGYECVDEEEEVDLFIGAFYHTPESQLKHFSCSLSVHDAITHHHGHGGSPPPPGWPETEIVLVRAGRPVALRCDGLGPDSLVRGLEWICSGCGGDRSSSPSHEATVAEFVSSSHEKEKKDAAVVVDPRRPVAPASHLDSDAKRVRLSLARNSGGGGVGPPPFALTLSPAVASDSGEYRCMVNGRRKPNSVVRLLVQGK